MFEGEKRRKGVHRKVSEQMKLPSKWIDFLCDPKTKTELLAFLTDKISTFTFPSTKLYMSHQHSLFYVHTGSARLRSWGSRYQGCSVPSASITTGMWTFEVGIVDTDIVVILVGIFYDLHAIQPLADIWVAFGVGKNYRFLSVNAHLGGT